MEDALNGITHAVIYEHVALKGKQASTLKAKVDACKEIAKRRSLNVEHVFSEEGMSSKAAERPELQKLITFLQEQDQPYAVITSENGSLSRDMKVYLEIRLQIREAGAVLVTSSGIQGDDATSQYQESVMAALSSFVDQIEEQQASSITES